MASNKILANEIEHKIISYLAANSGKKAREIAKALGLDKADINHYLYSSLKTILIQDNNYCWYLKNDSLKLDNKLSTDKKVQKNITMSSSDPIRVQEKINIDKSQQKISEMKFDKNFIKKLLDKLKVGNTRSIHLNAIPGRSSVRLDLCQLRSVEEKMPEDFLDAILNNESFKFFISYDKLDLSTIAEEEKRRIVLISKKLNNLVIENTDSFLEFGLKNFGFGYPLLIKRDKNDPEKIIKAPLFIWNLDIERSYQHKNSWTIKKEEDSPIKINELLISYLAKDESLKIEKISKEVLEDGILNKKELLELSENILSQLNSQSGNLEIKIEKCPEAKNIESMANSKPWIQWSGIFGVYRSQNETIIHSTEELLERFDEFENENLVLEQFQTSTISAVETDPSKEEIVNTLTKNEIKLIQGPPGTGKSQSITAIVSNALSNHANCLIVCEKKTALDVIQANLEREGLADFSIVIDDVNKDRKKVIERARRIKESLVDVPFSELDFNNKYKNFCQLKDELNSKFLENSPVNKIFGDFSWKQLIGLYLKYSRSGDVDKLSSNLQYKELRFDYGEYSEFISVVEQASFLFGGLEKDSENIFKYFDDNLFSAEYKWSVHEKVKKESEKLFIILDSIDKFLSNKKQDDYEVREVSLFTPNMVSEVLNCTNNCSKILEEIISLYKNGYNLAGSSFSEKRFLRDILLNLSYFVDSKNREIINIRKTIYKNINLLVISLEEIKKFGFNEFETLKFENFKSLEKLNDDVMLILKEIKKIKSKVLKIRENEIKLNGFETELLKIKENRIFNFELPNYISLGSQEAINNYYLQLNKGVKNINQHLDSYESFHNWKFFCVNKDKFILQTFSCLKELDTKNWKNVFSAWYYRGALLHYEENTTIGFNKSDSKLQQLVSIYNDLEKQQIKQIKSVWSILRNNKLYYASFNFNTLYNFRRNNAGPKNSLRNIIEKDFNTFTTLFPVILTNPGAANAIFPLTSGLFNIVIFDEASQLKVADTFTSLIRGQYKVIAGDEHQMPPSSYFQSTAEDLDIDGNENKEDVFSEDDEQSVLAEAESLLQYASDLKNISKSCLDFHYRSKHPALIEFSNNAFYGGNLIAFPAKEVYKPIEFRAVNGRYDTRTNPLEVVEILKIIENEIHLNNRGEYPSVGIATFNINQRNLITEALNAAAENNTDFANKLLGLRDKGLFVKNLENIQGDEKDIIIISTTYGIKPDGTFSQNFARLNRIEGYKLLNVLITRAKHKLYVCTSIPKEKYLSYADAIKNEGNNKKGILYAYLAYAEAISNHDEELAFNILKLLKEQSFEKPRIISSNDGLSESPFEEEVYDLLLNYFEKDKIIQQHKIGGFRLDFVIKAKSRDIVLECDGKAYHSSEEAYAQDMYRQKELEKMGYIVYRIWSTNWFQDKEVEMKKLISFVDSVK